MSDKESKFRLARNAEQNPDGPVSGRINGAPPPVSADVHFLHH